MKENMSGCFFSEHSVQQYFMLCVIKSYNNSAFVFLFNNAAINRKCVT